MTYDISKKKKKKSHSDWGGKWGGKASNWGAFAPHAPPPPPPWCRHCMRASGASELRKFWLFYILKLLFLSIFCRYIRYFVGTNDMLVGLYMYRQISKCTDKIFKCTDKTPKKHYWGGSCPPPTPCPPLATLMTRCALLLTWCNKRHYKRNIYWYLEHFRHSFKVKVPDKK